MDRAPAPGPVVDLPSLARPSGPVLGAQPAPRAAPRHPAARWPRGRKSAKALTRDVIERLIATCSKGTLADKRDAALLLITFASGDRRRSEIAGLRVEDLIERSPVPANPDEPSGRNLPVLGLRLGWTKTASREDDERVLAVGRPVEALKGLARGGGDFGEAGVPADRPLRSKRHLRPRRAERQRHRQGALPSRLARPAEFSAHGLRSGYLTEAARRGVPLPEAMRQSRHRSVQQAAAHYNEVETERGRSARLV